jgi:hypothetical protein
MSKLDPNKIVAIEQAIAKKYGEEAIQNPRNEWDEEKEKEYLKQMKEMYAKTRQNEVSAQKIDINGFKVSKKLFNRDSLGICPVCSSMPKRTIDDVCMLKFNCCGHCYIKYVEGREERWSAGWRPEINKE